MKYFIIDNAPSPDCPYMDPQYLETELDEETWRELLNREIGAYCESFDLTRKESKEYREHIEKLLREMNSCDLNGLTFYMEE